jgi:hypothetical protein
VGIEGSSVVGVTTFNTTVTINQRDVPKKEREVGTGRYVSVCTNISYLFVPFSNVSFDKSCDFGDDCKKMLWDGAKGEWRSVRIGLLNNKGFLGRTRCSVIEVAASSAIVKQLFLNMKGDEISDADFTNLLKGMVNTGSNVIQFNWNLEEIELEREEEEGWRVEEVGLWKLKVSP